MNAWHNSSKHTNKSSHRRALNTLVAYTAFTLLLSLINMSLARAESTSNPRVEEKLQSTLQARVPEIKIESVRAAPMAGLYELLTPSEIVYSDAKGELLFIGRIVDTKQRQDLTAKRWNETLRTDFNALPLDHAIKYVKGNGSRRLAIFADPHCPFCEKFERVVDQLNDVTIYLFLYPIADLHPDAPVAAHDIWCSIEPANAWRDWMLNRKAPAIAPKSCVDDPVAQNIVLGEKLKINATPTIFFADGNRVAGTMTLQQIEAALNERVATR